MTKSSAYQRNIVFTSQTPGVWRILLCSASFEEDHTTGKTKGRIVPGMLWEYHVQYFRCYLRCKGRHAWHQRYNKQTLTLGCDVMAHTKLQLSIKYLRTDLWGESMENVRAKVVEDLEWIEYIVGILCNTFVSDSCNFMRSVLAKILIQNAVKRVYGCVTHALNNFGKNVAKVRFDTALKQGLLVSKTMHSQNLLRRMFDTICDEKICKRNKMVLYSKTWWSSISMMDGMPT